MQGKKPKPANFARKPLELAKLDGSYAQNPKRYQQRLVSPRSDLPLGDCRAEMLPEARAVWHELVATLPSIILTGADRIALEVLCNLVAEYRQDPAAFNAARVAQMLNLMGRFGMSPVDRGRLGSQEPEPIDEDNTFARFAVDYIK